MLIDADAGQQPGARQPGGFELAGLGNDISCGE
jgi:hypothetical protein